MAYTHLVSGEAEEAMRTFRGGETAQVSDAGKLEALVAALARVDAGS